MTVLKKSFPYQRTPKKVAKGRSKEEIQAGGFAAREVTLDFAEAVEWLADRLPALFDQLGARPQPDVQEVLEALVDSFKRQREELVAVAVQVEADGADDDASSVVRVDLLLLG